MIKFRYTKIYVANTNLDNNLIEMNENEKP